ncbi:FAD-dependent monooxygenase [Actinomadura formosensis]|uniref:FAD-dependent monooxygenase n=1 Tax=Actinomadura formosensis TaxID=60706 RepID=UPI000AC381B2|nr:FAD-dependent monooxygenase [Actinomadura formosensis]
MTNTSSMKNTPSMKNSRVLISGASIGGPALAYWLNRYGFDVTVVELMPGLRLGGQAIDVRGPALDVAERMGVLDRIREQRVEMRGMSMVDAGGAELHRTEEYTFTGGDLSSPDIEILREDLSRILADAAGEGIEYLYGDSIAGLEQDDDGVRVIFHSGAIQTFDLVVGADGLHSNTRRLAFGPERDFLSHLGPYLAVWTAPNFLGLDRWQIGHRTPAGNWGGVMSVRGNTELRVFLGFESEKPIDYDHRDIAAQKKIMADALAGGGWVLPELIRTMWDAKDFHFDSMAQIRMDSWSRGRVVLLGDAGYCGSPMSGQGTSMAIVGAYVLAGELKAAGGDHRAAFANYERELRGYIEANQDLALANRAQVEEGRDGEVGMYDLQEFAKVVNSYQVKGY